METKDFGMFTLTETQKVLILTLCLGLLSLTIMLTICVVAPQCWLHKIFNKRRRREQMQNGHLYDTFGAVHQPPEALLQDTPKDKKAVTSLPPLNLSCTTETLPPPRSRKNTHDSTYGSLSSISRGNASVYSDTSLDTPIIDRDGDANYGQVTFSVRYSLEEGQNVGQLIIVLKELQDLPPRQYGGTCDPYLKLEVYREKGRKWRGSKHGSIPIFTFQSGTLRKTQHALFKETCVVDVCKGDLKHCAIKIMAFDSEKYANDTQLGELTLPLKNFNFSDGGQEEMLTYDLCEPRQDNGEILFGLNYLPTAERLTFTVIKANNLRSPLENPESLNIYVRILLIHNGKVIKKKKTSPQVGTISPSYNEMLTFDVPPRELDNIAFMVIATHRNPEDSVSSPETPTSPSTSQRQDRHVGKVIVGSCGKGTALHHWTAMKQSPRKQVAQWHTLR